MYYYNIFYTFVARDDLRLPRYLEKEKREKAEAKGRVEARDPDCPRGHVLLSESDRLAALTNAKKRKLPIIICIYHNLYIYFQLFNF